MHEPTLNLPMSFANIDFQEEPFESNRKPLEYWLFHQGMNSIVS